MPGKSEILTTSEASPHRLVCVEQALQHRPPVHRLAVFFGQNPGDLTL